MTTAFVLGGGGVHGAAEVGMLRALAERGIRPDLVVGTSIGAINGAVLAADPGTAVARLTELWTRTEDGNPFEASLLEQAATVARTWTHVHGNHRLQRLLLEVLPVRTFEELAIPFSCVAASIERAGPRWFDRGPLVPALLASSAVPGLLPPVEIDGEHHLDGGLVDSIPVDRALALGATRVLVLQVGRVERPLRPPTRPWEVASVAFEIARRSRFSETMERVPADVEVHLLPTGLEGHDVDRLTGLGALRYRDTSHVVARIDAAHRATLAHLDREGAAPTDGSG
jgi:NTE family protein